MSSTTLFLDRDGVLNARLPGDYVASWEAFHILPGVLDALVFFAHYFGRIVVVTNQQGIGKGKMTAADLADIHQRFLAVVEATGGRIDGIYYCPDLASTPGNCRKPDPAMAWQAKRDFPEINFTNAVMVGDSASDIEFGHKLGMQTVLISGKSDEIHKLNALKGSIDMEYPSLSAYASALKRVAEL